MPENKFSFLCDAFSDLHIQFSEDGLSAHILNPNYAENIIVYYEEDDDFTPFIACFSFQHAHLTDEELVDWAREIIDGSKFAIEFFKDGLRFFGGEISAEELHDLTYEKLVLFTDSSSSAKLLPLCDSFKVRGWNSDDNFDAVFSRDENGMVSIRKAVLV